MSNEQPIATQPRERRKEVDTSLDDDDTAVEDDLVGRVLSDRYRIEGCLGRGGMGAVYRAEHTLMKKTVAIKVLHSDVIGHGEAVERFRREAQAAAHIDHQNVCVATDFGEMQGGGFFLVMEYLEGNTLDETLICVERFEPGRAIHIASQICAALQQAHRLGVVHRDLKPENIMLVHRGDDPDFVKIMDFGVARVRIGEDASDSKITQAGRVYGTPFYMAPEQAAGSDQIDRRADLYTLGVMLFEMLTGSLPFVDDNPAKVMAMHMTREPPSLRKKAPEADISWRLERLVTRLMAKEPADRPSSAGEVRVELDELLEHRRKDRDTLAIKTRQIAASGTRALRAVTGRLRPVTNRLQPYIERVRRWLSGPAGGRRMAAVVGVAVLGGLLLAAALTLVGPEEVATLPEERQAQAERLAEQRESLLAKLEADEVAEALADGEESQVSEASERLEELREAHGDEVHLAFLYGRALLSEGESSEALAFYGEAIEGEPLYASDDEFVGDLLEVFSRGEEEPAERAEELLFAHLPEPVVDRKLSQLARMGKNGSVRERARNSLEERERLEELEEWNRAAIELRTAYGCDDHREKIDALVDAEDPRGLEVLRYYDDLPTTGCGPGKQQDCYGCVRGDIEEAIEALESLEDEKN